MKGKRSRQSIRSARNFYLYLSPWLVVFVLFTVIPMAFSLVMSFTSAKITTLTARPLEFLGFGNYKQIFTMDSRFLRSIGNTMIYSFAKVFFGTLARIAARAFAQYENTRAKALQNHDLSARGYARSRFHAPLETDDIPGQKHNQLRAEPAGDRGCELSFAQPGAGHGYRHQYLERLGAVYADTARGTAGRAAGSDRGGPARRCERRAALL